MREQEKQLALNFEKLGASNIALALVEAFTSPSMQHASLIDVLLEASHSELAQQKNSRAQRLLKMAKLHNTMANLDELEYGPERNLDKMTIDRLSTCEYIRTHANICIIGASGTGNYASCKVM